MIFLTLLLTYLLGYCVLNASAPKLTYLEKIGGGFLVGIGLQTIMMILMDFVQIPLNLTSIYSANLLVIFSTLFISYKADKNLLQSLFPYNPLRGKDFQKINLPWLVIMGFFSYMFYIIAVKCLFWPTFEFDAVSGYDMTAKMTAAEGTFRNSIFIETGIPIPRMSLRAIYPPLTQFSFALAYMSGMELSKIMTLMFDINFFILIYGLLRRELTHLNVSFIILLILITPELVGHMALSQTNLPQAVYVSTGIYSLYLWYKNSEKSPSLYYLSMFLLASSTLIRSENILFCLIAGSLVLFHSIQSKKRKDIVQMLIYAGVLIAPFILWTVFLKVYGLKGGEQNSLSLELGYNAKKFAEWWGLLFGGEQEKLGIVFNKNFYGITPHLYFAIALISSLYLGIYYYISRAKEQLKPQLKRQVKSQLTLLYLSFTCFFLYSIFFYFIRYDWDSMRNVLMYSYKRGLFAILILFCIFIGSNPLVKLGFDQITRFMYPKTN